MPFYEITYILTNIIYIFTVYKLFQIFFDEKTCTQKIKTILLSTYFIGLSLIIFVTRLPIIMLLLNLFFLFAISLTYKSSFQKKILSVSSICTIILVIELISSAIFGFFEFSGIKDSTFNSISVLIFTRIITLVLVYLMNRYIKSLKKEYRIPKNKQECFEIIEFVLSKDNALRTIEGTNPITTNVASTPIYSDNEIAEKLKIKYGMDELHYGDNFISNRFIKNSEYHWEFVSSQRVALMNFIENNISKEELFYEIKFIMEKWYNFYDRR